MKVFPVTNTIQPLLGATNIDGDKSCSHRSLILATNSFGVTKISGLLEAEDVLATKNALIALGASITKKGTDWIVKSNGPNFLTSPTKVLDLGNAGTGSRLLMGYLTSLNIFAVFTGDESLNKRPMLRVLKPLKLFGLNFIAREGNFLPLAITGNSDSIAIEYETEVPSAQVKSALLLAALNAVGISTIIEPIATRDHTEIMLAYLGYKINNIFKDGKRYIEVEGKKDIKAKDINIGGDPSSAAFIATMALLTKGSAIVIENILWNPSRIGFFQIIKKMGANINIVNERTLSGEKIVDIEVKYTENLQAIEIGEEFAPSTIDEYPILAILSCFAKGKTRMQGLGELRVKESDRLAAIVDNLALCGINTNSGDDWLEIEGPIKNTSLKDGVTIKTYHDHRIAMSFITLSLATGKSLIIDDIEMINTSFPNFFNILKKIGVKFSS